MGFKELVQKSKPKILRSYLKDAILFASQMKHLGYADLERAGIKERPEMIPYVIKNSRKKL
ncbi:hypothetical protein RM549_14505 [Salegentibacter sp. F188]|uniref:Uncharacterized protein n=1 Tax=Autumnicola patrickiae TaxID=3075591 RepID=A0ABU3E522_9FLAO|nr:hypothetical protein [Salegentibacter sp. F188]MDT0691003.1 hypothetical protein [Salegentibacter sp. F188]